MVILIDNYDSFTWNLYHYLAELGADVHVWRNDQITVEEVIAKKPQAIVLSPGPATPNEAGICLELIDAIKGKIPLLGVCLGHQAIGQVFGAKVVRAEKLMHGKVSTIIHDNRSVFEGIEGNFQATRYHSLTLAGETIPACLKVTAKTTDGVVMGIQHKTFPLFGVQFHPESIASENGYLILQNFLKRAGINIKPVPKTKNAFEKV